jgi:uncharacterized protein
MIDRGNSTHDCRTPMNQSSPHNETPPDSPLDPEIVVDGAPVPADLAATFTGRLSRWLVDRRWPLLGLGAVIAFVSWFPAQNLQYDRSVENMFAPGDPILAPYHQLQRTFGGNEVALAAYDDPQLLTPGGLERLDKLTAALEKVPGISTVLSLTRSPLGKQILIWPIAAQREAFLKLSEGYTVSADRQTAAVVCVFDKESASPIPRTETVDQLRATVDEIAPGGVLTGEPVMVVDGFRYLDEDGERLGIASTVLLSLTIIFCFRSVRWVIVPMAVVFTTLWMTEGLMVSGGFRLSMVSSMLWAVVAVIAIATVVHIVIGYRELRDDGFLPHDAMVITGGALAGPIFWACITDTAGFGSLLVSRVGPVHDFGLMMSLAAVLTLFAIMMLVPGLSLAGRIDADPKRAWGEGHLDFSLHWLSSLIERRPKMLGAAVLAITVPALLGTYWLEVESDFTKNFLRSSPIVHAYDFVESKLGGAGVWDIIVPVPKTNDPEFVAHVRRLEERLRHEVTVTDDQGSSARPGLTKVLSVVDAIDALVPGRQVGSAQLNATLAPLKKVMPIVGLLHGRDPQQQDREFVRIMLRAPERQGSAQKEALIQHVTTLSREEFPEAQVTGFFVLLTRLIESMLGDQWLTFILSTSGIFVMMLIAFRSIPVAIITLIPNALPIMVVTGLLGWSGLKINMGGAMIAAVSMGLAVDSSAHYITAFRSFRAQGQSIDQAMRSVHQSVGRAVVFSTLALIVGFTALCLSQFVPTIYFGVLVSLAMIGGMLGNLVILPLLLKFITPRDEPSAGQPTGTAAANREATATAPG